MTIESRYIRIDRGNPGDHEIAALVTALAAICQRHTARVAPMADRVGDPWPEYPGSRTWQTRRSHREPVTGRAL